MEYSLGLPISVLNSGGSKQILKDILFEMVPASLFKRPKWGFGLTRDHLPSGLMTIAGIAPENREMTLPKQFCLYNARNYTKPNLAGI